LPNKAAPAGIAEKELHFTVNTEDIVYINAILDSYEGLGIMRTIDRDAGHVAIYTATERELRKLLESLSKDEGVSCHERRGG
jgi:hypothetical protein